MEFTKVLHKKASSYGIVVFSMIIVWLFLCSPDVYAMSYEELYNDKVRVSNIWVSDFTTKNVYKNSEGDILIKDEEDYQLVYIRSNGTFLLSILGKPFPNIQLEAENELRKVLDVSRGASCRLNVHATTLYAVNPDYANRLVPLTYCEPEILADINQDCLVSTTDAQRVKDAYFLAGFNNEEDINGDGLVDSLDYSYIVQYMTRKVCSK